MTHRSVYITASVDNSGERHGIRAYIESYGRPALKIGNPKAEKTDRYAVYHVPSARQRQAATTMSDNAIGSHIPNISNAVACGMKRNVDVAMTPASSHNSN